MEALTVYGLLNHFFEPFGYGAAGFLLSYKYVSKESHRVVAMLLTAVVFLLIDDIWIEIISRDVGLGISSANDSVSSLMSEGGQVGNSQYYGGQESPLWAIPGVDLWDLVSLLAIPLAFAFGRSVVGRQNPRVSRKGPPPIGGAKST